RFHEVFRHVPAESENLGGIYSHNRWTVDESSRINLPEIVIPSKSITDRMALIHGSDSFPIGSDDSNTMHSHRRKVPSFYMDPCEFTVGEFRRIFDGAVPENHGAGADNYSA